MARKIKPIDLDDLVRRYESGASVLQLSREIGVSRGAITTRLKRADVDIRGRSEAESLKWKTRKSKPGYREIVSRQCAAAWAASKGRTHSDLEVAKRAVGMAGRSRTEVIHERDIVMLLAARGFPVQWQYPIHRYNVDIACHKLRVAVEIQREHWNPRHSRSHSLDHERVEHILDGGWSLLIVYAPPTFKYRGKTPIKGTRRERFDAVAVADKIAAFFKIASRDPSIAGQYGVIDGYAKPSSAVRLDFNGRARVRGF